MLQMMVSDAQKELLRMCWRSIQKNLESVGVVTFLKVLQLTSIIDNFGYFNAGNVVMPSSSLTKLFETHPETLKPFIPDVKSLREIELNEW